MTTKFTDRRCTADPAIDPEVESERMRRRRDIREQAARRDIELQPALLAEQDILASEGRCDTLADDHAVATAPLQTELSELEQRAIERIGRREPPDTAEDERRVELTKLISEATADLETAIAAERELQSIARRKARLIREGHPPADVILMALAKPLLGNPRLLAEAHVCRERRRWLQARLQAAKKALGINQYNVTEISERRSYGDLDANVRRVRDWEAEVAAVDAELEAAKAEGEAIHQQLLDE